MTGAQSAARAALALCLSLGATRAPATAPFPSPREAHQSSQPAHPQEPEAILRYIASGWDRLTRSMTDCATFQDAKSRGQPTLYLPAGFPEPAAVARLEAACGVAVRHLPQPIGKPGAIGVSALKPPGLLYLPNPYVVPGGQFNAMYGWDSYFIVRGLLRAGRVRLARGMVENFLFELEHYRIVLNANRTYYLTRSQPPFLAAMILAVYDAEASAGPKDLAWLARAYPFAVQNDEFWTRAPHLAGATGLSRYYGLGRGPAPEVLASDPTYYRDVAAYFLRHSNAAEGFLLRLEGGSAGAGEYPPFFTLYLCPGEGPATAAACGSVERVGLSAEFYKADRSLRESGFDVTFRFGPFGDQTPDYAPVGLNSLLYQTEKDLARMSLLLGHSGAAAEWERRASARRRLVNRYLWNDRRGLYFDYDFAKRRQSSYLFATTFYPLWVGLASPAQARSVAAHLGTFLEPGGVVTSLRNTGVQWDYPYGWAPLELVAAEGLRRYGFDADANRVATRFLATVLRNFRRDGTIREKYNVVTRSSKIQVQAGYRQNVIGFGWTNGVFLALWHELPTAQRDRLGEAAR